MFISATNTVTIQAVPGHAEAVGVLLRGVVGVLHKAKGCLSYVAVQNHHDCNLWIVMGHWATPLDMEEHFHSRAHDVYSALLNCKFVRSIEFNSLLIA